VRILLPMLAAIAFSSPVLAADPSVTATPLVVGPSSIVPVAMPVASLSPMVMGYGEVGVGGTVLRGEFGFTSENLATYAAGAYVNFPFGRGWNIEAEGRGYWVDWAGSYSASDVGTFFHLYRRDPERFSVGGFAGHTALSLYGMQGSMWTAGAEAQAYLEKLTLYGQAGGFNSSATAGWLYFSGFFVRGTARAFPAPNLRLQFDAQWAVINNSDRTSALTLVGTAEYRFQNSPLSAFASVRWDRLSPAINQSYQTTRFLFGVRGYFGSGSLFDNDRRGAPMDVIPFPPLYALNFG
jgi:hypothetical protein